MLCPPRPLTTQSPLSQVGLRHINDYVSYVWVRDNQVSFSDGLTQVPACFPEIGIPHLLHEGLPGHLSVFWKDQGGITCGELGGPQLGS